MRIEKLRQASLKPAINYNKYNLYFYKSYSAGEDKPLAMRYAEAFAYALSNIEPVITEGELIVGKPIWEFTEAEQKLWDEQYEQVYYKTVRELCVGQDSHMAVDVELLLKKGITGIIADVEKYKLQHPEKAEFYDSCLISLKAVLDFSCRYAETAEKMAEECEDSTTGSELLNIAAMCRKVPAEPAQSFYEAVQSVAFLLFVLSFNGYRFFQQFQGGRPDRYLYEYYKRDIENGSLTRESAQEIIDCFCIQINNRVPGGLSSGYMVGGKDENGNTVANELTHMFMTAVDDVRLVYPAVGLCYTSDMPDGYLRHACEILSRGRSHPAIFNDDVIAKGLMEYGVPEKDSRSYIHSTCVEITPIAASNAWVASPYTNMPLFLLDSMDKEYESFDQLVSRIFAKLDESIKNNFEEQNKYRKIRLKTVNPLLSCFVNDCLSKGVDIEQGGARYNWIMPSFVGIANLVDSLFALKTVVFENKEYTIADIRRMLDCNFEGYEAERLRFLNSIPKYGNDNDEVDSLFDVIKSHIVEECRKYKGMHQNGDIIPSAFCYIRHEQFGKETGATPDGRLSGFPLGDGSGPCQGREKCGPTASVLSSTKWSHHELIGGVAVNMKFSKSVMNENSIDTVMALIKTYMERGGFEIQVNVTDNSILEDAAKNPEKYSDLIVRVGGYSDYFVRLSKEMQLELMLRTTHNISYNSIFCGTDISLEYQREIEL